MKNLIRIFSVVLAAGAVSASCIRNDIPYPVRELQILGVSGAGFTCGVSDINNKDRIVTLNLEETTDPAKVSISKIEATEGSVMSVQAPGVFDVRSGLAVTLSQYPEQDYVWSIRYKQDIERYFNVESQIGSAEIDVENHTARAYVPMGTDLGDIKIKSLKLGPKDITTVSPAIEDITFVETYRTITVKYHDVTETWFLYVEETDVKVLVSQADAWTRVIWVYGQSLADTEQGFRYRKQGEDTWADVPASKIQVSGGDFKTCIGGLDPQTTYEVVAYSDDDVSSITTVTTEAEVALVNGGFEQWCEDNGIVYPGQTKDGAFWGTGNTGAKVGGEVVTDKTTEKRPGSTGQYAAKLESKKVAIAGIGKIAAGNLFVGKYIGTRGTNGIVGFGRPFTQRPTGIRGWVKYNCGNINEIGSVPPGMTIAKGDPDWGSIYVALGTWTPEEYGVCPKEGANPNMVGTVETPIAVDTRDVNTFFNPRSPAVVAYGELMYNASVEEWTQFTIKLDYVATNVVPTHLVLVCSSSRYGDYFTGSTQSTMWIDDFEFIYDEF